MSSVVDRTMVRDLARAHENQRRLGLDLTAMLPLPSMIERASMLDSVKWLTSEQKLWEGITKGLAASKLTAPQSLAAMLPAAIWESSMRSVLEGFQSVRLPELFPSITDQLLEPFVGYSRFARGTVKQIERSDAPAQVNALSGALALAEEHVLESADVLVGSVEDEELQEGTETLPELPSRLLMVQRRELLAAPEVEESAEYEVLVQASPSAGLAEQARNLTSAVVWCNRQAQALGDEEVFKLTTTFLAALNDLAWTAVVNDATLGHFVDCLYFVFYEGAGSGTLRFMRYLGKDDCGIVFTVKHLRNKLYAHDVEHGQPGDIRRSYRDLRAALKATGLGAPPRRKDEFQMIERSLLHQLAEFMNRLQDALAARGNE